MQRAAPGRDRAGAPHTATVADDGALALTIASLQQLERAQAMVATTQQRLAGRLQVMERQSVVPSASPAVRLAPYQGPIRRAMRASAQLLGVAAGSLTGGPKGAAGRISQLAESGLWQQPSGTVGPPLVPPSAPTRPCARLPPTLVAERAAAGPTLVGAPTPLGGLLGPAGASATVNPLGGMRGGRGVQGFLLDDGSSDDSS